MWLFYQLVSRLSQPTNKCHNSLSKYPPSACVLLTLRFSPYFSSIFLYQYYESINALSWSYSRLRKHSPSQDREVKKSPWLPWLPMVTCVGQFLSYKHSLPYGKTAGHWNRYRKYRLGQPHNTVGGIQANYPSTCTAVSLIQDHPRDHDVVVYCRWS